MVRLARVALMSLVMVAALHVPLADAQQAVDANCNYVANTEIGDDQKICNTWAPCAVMGKAIQGCAKVKQFFTNLGDTIRGKAKPITPDYDELPYEEKQSLFDRIKAKFSANDVAEAAEPKLTNSKPMKVNDDAVDKMIADYRAARAKAGAAPDPILNLPDGAIYQGQTKNGKANGVGTEIRADGTTLQGQFKDGNLNGLGEYRLPSDAMSAGRMADGALIAGADQRSDGTVAAGFRWNEGNRMVGKVEFTDTDGSSQIGYFDKDGKQLALGPESKPGEEPVAPPAPQGMPEEDDSDVPLWSPTTPAGSIISYEMEWVPGSAIPWASLLPDIPGDPLADARFCRPLVGKLTAAQAKACQEDKKDVKAAVEKDPIGNAMFCRPLLGSLTAEEKTACGIKDEPAPQATGCISGGAAAMMGGFGGLLASANAAGSGACTTIAGPQRPLTLEERKTLRMTGKMPDRTAMAAPQPASAPPADNAIYWPYTNAQLDQLYPRYRQACDAQIRAAYTVAVPEEMHRTEFLRDHYAGIAREEIQQEYNRISGYSAQVGGRDAAYNMILCADGFLLNTVRSR